MVISPSAYQATKIVTQRVRKPAFASVTGTSRSSGRPGENRKRHKDRTSRTTTAAPR